LLIIITSPAWLFLIGMDLIGEVLEW